jgi:dethiobiotin synthetase
MNRGGQITFVTGTDTGVGKTLLTGLLLDHLRHSGCHALAMKPFCSGGRADVDFLQSLQAGELSDVEMNPIYFPRAESPLVSLSRRQENVRLAEVLENIHAVKKKCERLLVEGSGGLLVPLGHGYTVADLVARLDCQVIIAARNRLGTINHTMLTINELRRRKSGYFSVVLMGDQARDESSLTNRTTLEKLLQAQVANIPFLGLNPQQKTIFPEHRKKLKKVLAQILK